jgi:chorismate mutase
MFKAGFCWHLVLFGSPALLNFSCCSGLALMALGCLNCVMAEQQLQDFRASIDNIDMAFMFLLAERMRIIVKAGLLKTKEGLDFEYSSEREEDLEKTFIFAEQRNVGRQVLEELFELVYQEALSTMEQLRVASHVAELNEDFYRSGLVDLRDSLYNIDQAICHALAERYHIVRKVAVFKKQQAMPALSPERWNAILKEKVKMAGQLGIRAGLVQDMMNCVHEESLRIERNLV